MILKPLRPKRYIRLPVELSRRDKVTVQMKQRMEVLRQRGFGWKRIGRELGVAPTTVRRHLDPAFRYRTNVSATKRSVLRQRDPLLYQRKLKQTAASSARIRQEFPPARRYRALRRTHHGQ